MKLVASDYSRVYTAVNVADPDGGDKDVPQSSGTECSAEPTHSICAEDHTTQDTHGDYWR